MGTITIVPNSQVENPDSGQQAWTFVGSSPYFKTSDGNYAVSNISQGSADSKGVMGTIWVDQATNAAPNLTGKTIDRVEIYLNGYQEGAATPPGAVGFYLAAALASNYLTNSLYYSGYGYYFPAAYTWNKVFDGVPGANATADFIIGALNANDLAHAVQHYNHAGSPIPGISSFRLNAMYMVITFSDPLNPLNFGSKTGVPNSRQVSPSQTLSGTGPTGTNFSTTFVSPDPSARWFRNGVEQPTSGRLNCQMGDVLRIEANCPPTDGQQWVHDLQITYNAILYNNPFTTIAQTAPPPAGPAALWEI